MLSRLSHRNQFHAIHCPNTTFLLKPVPSSRLYESITKVFKETNALFLDDNIKNIDTSIDTKNHGSNSSNVKLDLPQKCVFLILYLLIIFL